MLKQTGYKEKLKILLRKIVKRVKARKERTQKIT